MRILDSIALLLISSTLFISRSYATDISVSIDNHVISANILNINYNRNVMQEELKSGLPNELDVVLKMSSQNTVFHRYSLSFVITYDLWDEQYIVKRLDSKSSTRRVFSDENALFAYLENIEITGLYKFSNLSGNSPFLLTYRSFFNTVKSERIKRIRNWIRTSNGYKELESDDEQVTPIHSRPIAGSVAIQHGIGAITKIQSPVTSSAPRFQKLFDKILEEHMSEESISAQWKSKPYSKIFYLERLSIEKPEN